MSEKVETVVVIGLEGIEKKMRELGIRRVRWGEPYREPVNIIPENRKDV